MSLATALLLGAVTISPSSEIVVATNAPYATRLAARELNGFFAGIFGAPLPVVAVRSGRGATAIRLGGGRAHDRDGFVIEATNDVVSIFGNDDDVSGGDIAPTCWYGDEAPWQPHFRRGTLFGVYEFLERHAGVRMYFPGPIGTIVPCAASLTVPEGRLALAPAFRYRRYGFADGPLADADKLLNWYRLRMETETVKCSHGHRRLNLFARFGKSHPEYFANHHNPFVRAKVRAAGHLCHSSRVWDEIERDARAFFAGGATDTFDLMPQDGMTPRFRCACPACSAAYDESRQYATDLVWRRTADLAARVGVDFPTARFTQMAYHPYGAVPRFQLPANLDVTVARKGPWARALPALDRADCDEVRAWAAKLGRKVTLWNYVGKSKNSVVNLPDAPQLAPRAWAAYYAALADVIDGAFAESESDRWAYNYLNYYVFSRVCWNPRVDVEAILREHHALMFGPAARPMAAFYDALERLWADCVAAGFAEIVSDIGLTTKHSAAAASRKIYSPAALANLKRLLDEASALVRTAGDDAFARRVEWARREFFTPLFCRYCQK